MAMDYARGFYNSRAWKRVQAAYMASRHYVCERCGGVARIVHQRIYITPENIHDPNITLKWGNLEVLCQECHNTEHGGGGPCSAGLRFDEDGNIVKA